MHVKCAERGKLTLPLLRDRPPLEYAFQYPKLNSQLVILLDWGLFRALVVSGIYHVWSRVAAALAWRGALSSSPFLTLLSHLNQHHRIN